MVTVGLAEARDNIASPLERVEEALITRAGPPTAVEPEKVPMSDILADLRAFRESMPPWRQSSAELIREMRDEEY